MADKAKLRLKKAGRKRRVAGWVLFALGLLVTGTAATMLIAIYGPQIETDFNVQPQSGVLDTRGNGDRYLTFWQYEVPDFFLATLPPPSLDELETRAFASRLYGEILWATPSPVPPGTVYTTRITTLYRAGWPAHVLRSRTSKVASNTPGTGWGPSRVENQPMILSGLVIDVLFWSSATWGFLVLLKKARLWLKLLTRRAGQCTECGYNLAGLALDAPCPECGKTKAP